MLGIQIAGRLVGENDLGLMHDRSRNRDTLLFPAREFAGAMVSPCSHRDQLKYLLNAGLDRCPSLPSQQQGKRNILRCRQSGD
jgi:hypothetical protein